MPLGNLRVSAPSCCFCFRFGHHAIERDQAHHPAFDGEDALNEVADPAGCHLGRRLHRVLTDGDDVRNGVYENTDYLVAYLCHDDHMTRGRLGQRKPSRAERSRIGSTAPRRLMTPRTKDGERGSGVTGTQPRISRTDMMSTQNSCSRAERNEFQLTG